MVTATLAGTYTFSTPMAEEPMAGKNELKNSLIPSGNALLFSSFAKEQYLPFAREHKRSWKTDERYLATHVLPYLGSYPIAAISEKTLKDWISSLELSGLSHASCYRIFWLVKYMLNCAVRWHILASNELFKNAVCRKATQRSPKQLSPEEALNLVHMLEEYPGRSTAQAIHLLLLTGANKSEILHARWEDVDFSRGVLATGKTFTGRRRLIPLNNEAIKLIRSLPRYENVPWLFSSAGGKRLVSLYYTWNLLRIRLGRPELRLQDLRHTFAGFLMNMGIQKTELRSIMGHYLPETLAALRISSNYPR